MKHSHEPCGHNTASFSLPFTEINMHPYVVPIFMIILSRQSNSIENYNMVVASNKPHEAYWQNIKPLGVSSETLVESKGS